MEELNNNRYFTRLDYWHLPKNKLQDGITDYVKTLQRLILNSGQVINLINLLDNVVQELNQEHKRCRPEKLLAFRIEPSNGNIYLDFGFTCLELNAESIGWDSNSQSDAEALRISNVIVSRIRQAKLKILNL